jgi:hypothetical protein
MAQKTKRCGLLVGVGVIAAAIVVSAFWPKAQSEAAQTLDDSRILNIFHAGPVSIEEGDNATTRFFLPAVQCVEARVTILDGTSNTIAFAEKYVTCPPQGDTSPSAQPFFDITFDIAAVDGSLVLTDSHGQKVLGPLTEGRGIIAILIGVRLPQGNGRRPAEFRQAIGSLQIEKGFYNPGGPPRQTFSLLLPYIADGR